MIQHMIFETKSPFLIIVELENMCRKNLPLSLRLLIDTRICLEWNDLQQHQFWGRLHRLLGTPISKPEIDEENPPEPNTWPTLEEMRAILHENVAACDEDWDANDTIELNCN
ncbi:hypothetical protein B566_EDAN002039 [Ephemera danica]|nr:hypothetical protein B566_EDAN002039 [Ephemera danica]